ncbi:TadE family protein [Actinomycetes bacterium KLBMP 9797]
MKQRRTWIRDRVHGRRRPLGADRGSTTVEMVGYYAAMLAALLVGVQAAAWGLAELATRYAANHALQVARVEGGTAAAGQSDATTVLAQLNTNLVSQPTVAVTRSTTTATVTVKGTAIKVIPFLSIPVGTTVSGPVETLDPVP